MDLDEVALGQYVIEVKHYVYGNPQTVESCVSQKRENLRFLTCFTLLRTYI